MTLPVPRSTRSSSTLRAISSSAPDLGTRSRSGEAPTIRKELAALDPIEVTQAVATSAGNMKSNFIIHANGPKFHEENTEQKLKQTILNAMKCAEARGVESIAFPPMGAGFYGVPLDKSAEITTETLAHYMNNGSKIQNVIICANDTREYVALQKQMNNLHLMGSFKDK